MARSDSFFIRATVDTNGTTYAQTSLDLGSFVDALGKTVLRIHNVAVQYGNPTDLPTGPGAGGSAMTSYQLTTQSQGAMVNAANRTVVSSGKLIAGFEAVTNAIVSLSDMSDLSPQEYTNGYLIAVESLFIGTDSVGNALVGEVTIVLECTVETMTAAASMALALSQQ
jgi:hypothetical protein